MKIAVMQPYFFPYLGYFQLIKAVDAFVIYDNIQFSKKGWIHRNRILLNGKPEYFSINIQKDSDYLDVRERKISPVFFNKEMPKILRKIRQEYMQAPFFEEVFPFLESVFRYEENNLFQYISNSLHETLNYIGLDKEIITSSSLHIDHQKKNTSKIIQICKELKGEIYINPPGGRDLYTRNEFLGEGIELLFLEPNLVPYEQFGGEFWEGLSIIDILMHNSPETILEFFEKYNLK